jgi:hypothetical protein
VLAAIVPLAALGVRAVSARGRALLVPSVVATIVFYTFYELTPIHPRFLFVLLPVVLVLWAAGVGLAARVAYRLAR